MIFVTGKLGGSIQGRHLDFEPRLTEARWLAESFSIHSMIDLSDGLASDLRHVLKASHVGAELLAKAVPISREARLAADDSARVIEAATASYRAGEATLTDLLDALRTAWAASVREIDVRGRALETHRALEAVLGRPLSGGGK